jgi:hypothetical protein
MQRKYHDSLFMLLDAVDRSYARIPEPICIISLKNINRDARSQLACHIKTLIYFPLSCMNLSSSLNTTTDEESFNRWREMDCIFDME